MTELHTPLKGPYRVKLTDIFEGPMDLLVHLIKKNEVNIYDIPIALITEQYLHYLQWLDALNVDYAAEFVVMASSLAQIKSRMLLPVHPEEEGEEEDPRQMIVRPLLEYLKLKSAAEQLAERPLLGEDTFTRPAQPAKQTLSGEEEVIKIGLFELIDAFREFSPACRMRPRSNSPPTPSRSRSVLRRSPMPWKIVGPLPFSSCSPSSLRAAKS